MFSNVIWNGGSASKALLLPALDQRELAAEKAGGAETRVPVWLFTLYTDAQF
jgi:hypothetical protein